MNRPTKTGSRLVWMRWITSAAPVAAGPGHRYSCCRHRRLGGGPGPAHVVLPARISDASWLRAFHAIIALLLLRRFRL